MNQDDSKRATSEKLEELRRKLNEEVEKREFNLCAPSVMEISVELDQRIVEHYQKF